MKIQDVENKNRVIGILFDVSGSMRQPFYDLSKTIKDKKEQVNRVDSIINVIKTLCKKERTTLFALLFGCEGDEYKNQLLDFIFLLRKLGEIKNFNEEINSEQINGYYNSKESEKENENSYGNELKRLLSKNGKRKLYIDKYIFTKFNEGKLKLMCDLLRGDEELCGSIYKQLDSSCKSASSSIFKSSIGGNIFKDRERKAVFESVDKFLELAFNKNKHKLPPLIPMYIEERFNRKKNKKLTDISGSELINIISKIQSKIDSNSQIMSIFEKEIYWDTPLFTAFNVALEKFCTDFKTNKKILLIITDGLANDTNDKFYTDKIYNSALTNDIILIGIYISEKKKKMKIKYLYLK